MIMSRWYTSTNVSWRPLKPYAASEINISTIAENFESTSMRLKSYAEDFTLRMPSWNSCRLTTIN